MNQDIIYEICRYLYLVDDNGGPLLSRKISISLKKYNDTILRKFDKPLVFTILARDLKYIEEFDSGSTLYIGSSSYKKKEHVPYEYIVTDHKLLYQ